MKKLCRAAAALLLFLSLSCTAPLFNNELSMTALVSGKLDKLFESRFVWPGGFSDDLVGILPHLGSDEPALALLYYTSGHDGQIRFFHSETSGPAYQLEISGNPSTYPLRGASFGKGSDDFTRFITTTEENDEVIILGFDHRGNSVAGFKFALQEILGNLGSHDGFTYPAKNWWTILGIHFVPHREDHQKFVLNILALASDAPANNGLYELSFLLNADGGGADLVENLNQQRFGSPYLSTSLLSGLEFASMMGGYFYDSNRGQSYANYWSGTSYRTLIWKEGSSDVTELPIGEKILALLSTGEILTRDGVYGQVYGPGGNKKYRFFLGDLQFGYEFYRGGEGGTGGQPGLVFSRLVRDDENYEAFSLQVYLIPTKKLRKLSR